ncbi:MAG TPA: hypothetical protein VFV01_29715 [Spirillospora sp.]|nr:hypothetical protein [Spirillospora sp.]
MRVVLVVRPAITVPRSALASAVSCGRPPRHCLIALSLSHTSVLGAASSVHIPANRSPAAREGTAREGSTRVIIHRE